MDILELVHEDRSAIVRPYACAEDRCYKSFARRSDLVRHMRIHSNDRPFACHFSGCTRDFIQRSALTVHIRVHTGERPHRCEYDGCEKAFSDSSSLARHRRIHTGKRPYKCPVVSCRKDFCRKTTLTKHIKRNHPGSPSMSHESLGSQTPQFEYSGSATGNSTAPSTPSDGHRGSPSFDGPYFPPHDHQHLPHTPQVHASAYYAHPQSQGPHFKGHGSPGSWSAPGHLENQSHREFREQMYRRDSGEAAYLTPPPQHPRHMREPTVEEHPGECTCGNPPPPSIYEQQPPQEAFPPMVLRAASPTPQFSYQPGPHSTRPHFTAPFSSSSTHHFAAPYSNPMPSHEFSPYTHDSSSPILNHRRASSASALDFPTHLASGLGISVDERHRQYSADAGGYTDEGYGGPEIQYGRRSSTAGPTAGWAPRGSFSSYVTQHIERMQDGEEVGAEYA